MAARSSNHEPNDPAAPVAGLLEREGLTRLELRRGDRHELAWIQATPTGSYEALQAVAGEFLSPAELGELLALRYETRRRSWLLGRHAAKRAASAFLDGADPRGLEIVRGVFDQPVLRAGHLDVPGVAISHTTAWAVGLAHPAGHPMAVDLEEVRPAQSGTIATQLTPEELSWARAGAETGAGTEAEAIRLTVLWTAKEALSKALRCGLTVPFTLLATARWEPMPDGRITGGFEHFGQYRFLAWPDPRRVLTLVLPRRTELACRPLLP